MTATEPRKLTAAAEQQRIKANADTLKRLTTSRPTLTGVAPAGEVVPGFTPATILTSGAPLSWPQYTGGQRRAIISAALYEGLAPTPEAAVAALERGDIQVGSTQQYGCIGSVAGIYTASMPVLVVRDEAYGNTAFCNLYEGKSRHRLNYGSYNDEVRDGLRWLGETMGPVLNETLAITGPIVLQPIIARALRLGDELHSRNTAGTLLLQRALTDGLFQLARKQDREAPVREVLDFFATNDYTFLRLSMAAAKATTDAAHGLEHSSVVTGMVLSCREFAIRVSGMDDTWYRGEFPDLEGRFFDGFTADDAEWLGGESCLTETIGLGGFAQACAPTLQDYQGGTYQTMVDNNRAMYEITIGEHPDFLIPAFDFRGSPIGIDIFSVMTSGITPVIDGGLAGKDGGQIGAGVLRTRPEVFTAAADDFIRRHQLES